MSETTFMGVPRSRIDWYPKIDDNKCVEGCMECVKFCPHDVFEVCEKEEPKPRIKNPKNCVVFCRSCALTCGTDAMEFPDKNETIVQIKKIRKETAAHA